MADDEITVQEGEKTIKTRKTYLVKENFQKRFILKTLGFPMVILALSGAIFILSFLVQGQGSRVGNWWSEFVILTTMTAINTRIVFTLTIVAGLLFLFAFYLSHQIAGPIFKVEKEVERLLAGDLSRPVVLRDDDEFQELAEGLDQICSEMKSVVTRTRELAGMISSGIGNETKVRGIAEEILKDLEKYKI